MLAAIAQYEIAEHAPAMQAEIAGLLREYRQVNGDGKDPRDFWTTRA